MDLDSRLAPYTWGPEREECSCAPSEGLATGPDVSTIPTSVPVGTVFCRRWCVGVIQVEVGQDDPRHRSSVVEHTLGKGEVTGSNPVGGLGIDVVVVGLQQ